MATDRLKIYNGALLLCGAAHLSALSDNVEARHLLDLVWNDGGVRYCLEQGQWHFAMRSSELDYNPSITPEWGFSRAFTKPSDWVTTSGVFEDEFLQSPLTQYADEIMYWFADRDVIYVKYVSDDVTYGMDFSKWPASFTDFVKAYFASRICHKMPNSQALTTRLHGPPGREDLGLLNRTMRIAKNKAAMALPVTFPNRGTWSAARHAGMRLSWDGGNTTRLIG